MKNIKATSLSLIAVAFLCACSTAKTDFSFKDDRSLPYFSRRGENYLQRSAISNSIATVTTATDSTRLIDEISKGRDIPFYIYQTNCEHCRKFESKMINYCLDSMTEVYSMELSSGMAEIYKLIEAFPSYASTMSELSTPAIFYLNKDEAKEISIYSHMSTAEDFEKFMAPTYNNTRIYRYTTYAGFMKCAEGTEGLIYVDNGSDEGKAIETSGLEEAKHYDKRLAWIEWNYLSEEDKASFISLFGSDRTSIIATYKKGGELVSSVDYVDDQQIALKFISDYYEA